MIRFLAQPSPAPPPPAVPDWQRDLTHVCSAMGINPGCTAADQMVNPDQAPNQLTDPLGYSAWQTGHFAADMITTAMTWWVTPTINPDQPAVQLAQSYTWPIVGFIVVCSILIQAIRMAMTRKATPLVEIGGGVLRYLMATTLGLTVLGAAVVFTDGVSSWILQAVANDFAKKMEVTLTVQMKQEPMALLVLAGILAVLGAVQWVLAFFRQAGIVVLAALIPLAAAGSFTPATRPWLNKLVSWCAALVVYKFVAAVIYAIGFSLITSGGTS